MQERKEQERETRTGKCERRNKTGKNMFEQKIKNKNKMNETTTNK